MDFEFIFSYKIQFGCSLNKLNAAVLVKNEMKYVHVINFGVFNVILLCILNGDLRKVSKMEYFESDIGSHGY